MHQLDQLKQFTTVVADTGNFKQLAQFAPRDATTNPSLILKAVQQPDYAPLLGATVAAHRGQPLEAIVDQVLVAFGLEILKVVPGRVSTEVDARLDAIGGAAAEALKSRAGLANARLAYELFGQEFATAEAQKALDELIARRGCNQRTLYEPVDSRFGPGHRAVAVDGVCTILRSGSEMDHGVERNGVDLSGR